MDWLRPDEQIGAQEGGGLLQRVARQLLNPALLVAAVCPLTHVARHADASEVRIRLQRRAPDGARKRPRPAPAGTNPARVRDIRRDRPRPAATAEQAEVSG
ncbi:hypothetical protein ACSX1C_08580 [Pseudomonas sp. MBLB4123]|uniref:hypothetical protein n=1 Tax=Pseudomonas sp. MBLB4123 TaxID=3451557 RepID=UPI003F74F95E